MPPWYWCGPSMLFYIDSTHVASICIYIYMHMYMYIYIYIEREKDMQYTHTSYLTYKRYNLHKPTITAATAYHTMICIHSAGGARAAEGRWWNSRTQASYRRSLSDWIYYDVIQYNIMNHIYIYIYIYIMSRLSALRHEGVVGLRLHVHELLHVFMFWYTAPSVYWLSFCSFCLFMVLVCWLLSYN